MAKYMIYIRRYISGKVAATCTRDAREGAADDDKAAECWRLGGGGGGGSIILIIIGCFLKAGEGHPQGVGLVRKVTAFVFIKVRQRRNAKWLHFMASWQSWHWRQWRGSSKYWKPVMKMNNQLYKAHTLRAPRDGCRSGAKGPKGQKDNGLSSSV